MQSDTDWVGRDLQRLARESKLLRKPTDEEWERIWRAATDWADAIGVITMSMSIEPFVREHAPGVLRDSTTTSAKSSPPNPPPGAPTAPAPSPAPESRDRTRRAPRTSERPKANGKPAGS